MRAWVLAIEIEKRGRFEMNLEDEGAILAPCTPMLFLIKRKYIADNSSLLSSGLRFSNFMKP